MKTVFVPSGSVNTLVSYIQLLVCYSSQHAARLSLPRLGLYIRSEIAHTCRFHALRRKVLYRLQDIGFSLKQTVDGSTLL